MKIGRNDPCHCGSGKKYKHCCYAKDTEKKEEPQVETAATDAEEQEDESVAPQGKSKHNKSKVPFHGKSKGGSGGFRPRTSRGAQRGS